ncbi:electron transfer flavoprotein subunit alpha/FixB family protein [Ochrovirga pacifica]|uniref:electron transfer flavoprotein subunit alpha/FixB family protein n=1 Tax=Ochrovirga pacifica TaxID=1042376 RepID=UPI0002559D51|nr:FAD-binding protein [Ochrovirga pacifica]
MSVLVFADTSEGIYKKSTLETVSYAKAISDLLGSELVAVSMNATDNTALQNYGANQIVNVQSASLNNKQYAATLTQIAKEKNSTVVVLGNNAIGNSVAPLIAAQLKAGYTSNVVAVPINTAPFTVVRKNFSGKAFGQTQILSEVKVIGLAKNSFGIVEKPTTATVTDFQATETNTTLASVSVDKNSGKIAIADADIVVSGGRGLKEASNFSLIEDLAEVLGAATACSKPVSDMGWRPHSEHVGQTGKPVAANLYIAVAISGAIQHLAGVNASKTKVVINTDPEAPFFKAADYGIVGDAFEVVPKLIEKLKAFKAENA